MKKTLFIALLAVSCCTVRAQGRVEFGIKGGLSVANMTDMGQSVYDYSPIASVHGGALLNIKFGYGFSGFALQPELVFSGQGGVAPFPGSDGYTHNYTTHLAYMNVPILLQYQFRSGFRIETGPQFGVLLSATESGYDEHNRNTSDIYHSTDFSWALGGAYVWRNGFGFDARVNIGLSNINSDTNTGEDANMNNDVFQIGAFYQFGHRYARY